MAQKQNFIFNESFSDKIDSKDAPKPKSSLSTIDFVFISVTIWVITFFIFMISFSFQAAFPQWLKIMGDQSYIDQASIIFSTTFATMVSIAILAITFILQSRK